MTDDVTEDDLVPRMTAALENGRKIEAIKLYREARGSSLMEAKTFVDQLVPQLIEQDPERFGHLRGGSGAGCGAKAAGLLIALSALSYFAVQAFAAG